jgi:uncharacterized membrane protein
MFGEFIMKTNWVTIFAVILTALVVGGLVKLAFAIITNVWFWVGVVVLALTHCAIKTDERAAKNCKKKR